MNYAKSGLRVICHAMRELNETEATKLTEYLDNVAEGEIEIGLLTSFEKNLNFIGLSALEDSLCD